MPAPILTNPPATLPSDVAGDPAAFGVAKDTWYNWYKTAWVQIATAFGWMQTTLDGTAANATTATNAATAAGNSATTAGNAANTATTKANDAETARAAAVTAKTAAETAAAAAATFNPALYVARTGSPMTGPLVQAAGTAALPSYTFTGSTSTGIYSPGANRVGIATSGVQWVEVDASGNVGLGTAAPAYKLHQEAAAGTYHLLKSGNTATSGVLFGDTDSNVVGRVQYAHNGDVLQLFAGGAEGLRISASGVFVVNGGALGYGVGSGGTATQSTNKATGVPINKPTGYIAMHNAALAAGASVTFVVSNNTVAVNDTVIACLRTTYASYATYRVMVEAVQTGQFAITLTNISGGSLSEAVGINFAVIKGVTS